MKVGPSNTHAGNFVRITNGVEYGTVESRSARTAEILVPVPTSTDKQDWCVGMKHKIEKEAKYLVA